MGWLRYVVLPTLLLVAAWPTGARAACVNPTGSAGQMIYNGDAHIPQYCNDITWVAMANSGTVMNGLIGYWKLDDGSGTSATDSSGNGNGGTLVNGPVWTTGKFAGALTFDGTNDKISLAGITTGTTFTYSAWIKPNAPADSYAALFSQASSLGFWYRGSGAGANAGKITYYYSGADHHNTTALTDGVWQHIAVTVDNGNVAFYLNGSPDGTASSAQSFTADTMGDDTTSETFKGDLDDVRFYNRALTAAEITTLYNYHMSPPSSGLVGWWKLDESTGNTSLDSSGSGNNGTWNNSPASAAGKIGNAVSFTANTGNISTNQWIMIGDPAVLNFGTGSFSYGLWVYPTGNNTNWDMPFFKGGSSVSWRGYDMELGAGSWTANIDDGTTLVQANFSGSPFTNQWKHLFVVVDRGANLMKTYLDGVLANSSSIAGLGSLSTGGTYVSRAVIGGSYDDSGSPIGNTLPFKGLIDDVRIYNRALSDDEIYGIYRTSSPVCASPSGYEGEVMYNGGSNHVLQFCDNASWRPLGPVPGAGGGGCASPTGAEGDTIYNDSAKGSGVMQYCDGTNWIQIGGPNLPTSGLVGYWKLDETSGTSAADSSGSSNTGTLTNGPVWTTSGKDSGALSFDGTNDYVALASNLPTSYPFTYAAWFKTSDTGTTIDKPIVVMENSTSYVIRAQLYMSRDPGLTGKVAWNVRNGAEAEIFSNNALNDGVWHHVVGVSASATDHKLYVDGILNGTSSTSVTMFSSNLVSSIGKRFANGDTPSPHLFTGIIDDVRVYNRALSAQEIWQLYSGT